MEAIEYLKQRDQWVAHDIDKVPFGAHGEPASSTDPTTWLSFDDARTLQRERRLAGVGFVMSKDDDLVGIDLDKAIASDGSLKPWAEEIVRQLNSYTEVSPSGRGLHIWVRGQLPAGGRSKKIEDGRLEVYEKARYFTVTGRHLHGTPETISEWGRTVGEWYWMHFEAAAPPPVDVFEVDQDLDKELADALGYIDATDYHVWVTIGFAVKSHFGDAGFELWRQWSATAGNYCGDDRAYRKYRSFGKKSGVTYRTIFHFAMEGGYKPPARYMSAEDIFPGIDAFCRAILDQEEPWKAEEEPEQWEGVEDEEVEEEGAWAFDASELRASQSQREYLIGPRVAGFGDVIVMAGPPKSMKSFVTLDMLAHFACGEQWHGMAPARPLRSLLLNCELHIDAVAERMQMLGKSPPPGSLYITDRIRTGISREMVASMKAHVAEHGPFDLLVIDPIANLFTEDNENDNKAMLTFLQHLTQLRKVTTSDDSILWLVHHARKAELKELEADPFNSFRGASALRGFYDTGIAVWRQKGGKIGVDFEMRNGEGMERISFKFAQGIFERVDDDEEPVSKSDLEIIESVACSTIFPSVTAMADACEAQGERCGRPKRGNSARTWTRKINDAIRSGHVVEFEDGFEWAD